MEGIQTFKIRLEWDVSVSNTDVQEIYVGGTTAE